MTSQPGKDAMTGNVQVDGSSACRGVLSRESNGDSVFLPTSKRLR